MGRLKYFVALHLCILVFSMTEVLGKFAAITYNEHGLHDIRLYIFLVLMLFVCVFYAFCWQKVIRHFDLHIGYANRSVYLVWSQLWAYLIFSESLTVRNIIGMFTVMFGVIVVSLSENKEEKEADE